MRKNKNTSKIILATIVAFLATLISFSAFNNMNKQLLDQQKLISLMQNTKPEANATYTYAIATKDLKAGELISDADVDFKEFDTQDLGNFDNRSDVVNKVLLKDITIGEPFTNLHIARISDDTSLREGYRALTLPTESFQGLSQRMIPGTKVDILRSSGGDDWGLESVKIIGYEGSKGEGDANIPTNAKCITLEVPSEKISDFISTVSRNKLMLITRGPNAKRILKTRAQIAPSSGFPAFPSLPKMPMIENMSGLPQPIGPITPQSEVEVIEANVKSKVTFN